jgi:hypothetical protein
MLGDKIKDIILSIETEIDFLQLCIQHREEVLHNGWFNPNFGYERIEKQMNVFMYMLSKLREFHTLAKEIHKIETQYI